ncbi:hypothetical protein Csa_023705, partial [Cucumis sativus]
ERAGKRKTKIHEKKRIEIHDKDEDKKSRLKHIYGKNPQIRREPTAKTQFVQRERGKPRSSEERRFVEEDDERRRGRQ